MNKKINLKIKENIFLLKKIKIIKLRIKCRTTILIECCKHVVIKFLETFPKTKKTH